MQVDFALREYGLREKEVNVYKALLSLGNITASQLAKRLQYPRTTIYNTLNYLAQKGLVSKITKKNINYFEATNPNILLDNLKTRQEIIASVLPELEGLKRLVKETSSAEIFEGAKGLSTILSDIFNKKQTVYYFGSYSNSKKVLAHLPEHFRTIRLEKKIPARIVIDPYREKTFQTKEYKKITEMRFSTGLKEFPCMIFIYGQKVALYTVKGDLIGMIIKNKEIAIAMRMMFDMYWRTSSLASKR